MTEPTFPVTLTVAVTLLARPEHDSWVVCCAECGAYGKGEIRRIPSTFLASCTECGTVMTVVIAPDPGSDPGSDPGPAADRHHLARCLHQSPNLPALAPLAIPPATTAPPPPDTSPRTGTRRILRQVARRLRQLLGVIR